MNAHQFDEILGFHIKNSKYTHIGTSKVHKVLKIQCYINPENPNMLTGEVVDPGISNRSIGEYAETWIKNCLY
jgi:hypothetical protein